MLTLHDYLTLCASCAGLKPEQADAWLLYHVGQRSENEKPLCDRPSFYMVARHLSKKGQKRVTASQAFHREKAANALLQPLIEARLRQSVVIEYTPPEESEGRFKMAVAKGADAWDMTDIVPLTAHRNLLESVKA